MKDRVSHADAAKMRELMHDKWCGYLEKCKEIGARPNARAFVANWNAEHPDLAVSYSHFAQNIKSLK